MRHKARELFSDAKKQKIKPIGPPLLEYEVESDIQRRLRSGPISFAVAEEVLKRFYSAKIEIVTHTDLVRRAREIDRQYRQERIYDALYAALAELRSCEFWTADRAFYEAVKPGLSFVSFLVDYA